MKPIKLQGGITLCMNCNQPTKGRYTYRGVVLCSHCFSLAQHCDKRAARQVEQLLAIYREGLRVAAASGRLTAGQPFAKTDRSTRPPTVADAQQFFEQLSRALKPD